MLKSNIVADKVESTRSKSYMGDAPGTSVLPRGRNFQTWMAWVLVSCACLAVPVAEAAKPVVKIAKIAATTEGSSVTLDASASTDKDGDVLSFRWTQAGGTAVSLKNAQSAIATFVAPAIVSNGKKAAPIKLKFQLEVDDGNTNRKLAVVKKTVTVTVKPAATAPVAKAGADKIVRPGVAVTLNGSQTTGAGSYAWTQTAGAAVSLTGANSAVVSFIAPTVTSATVLTFKLTASNSAGSSDDSVNVTVSPDAPTLPVANAGSDQTVAAGSVVSLNGSQSSGVQSYAWQQTAGPSVTLQQANAATAGFTAPTVTTATLLTFKLTVTNSVGSTDDSVSVTVTPASALKANFSMTATSIDINDEAEAVITEISGGKKPYRVSFDWGDSHHSDAKSLGDVSHHSDTHYYAAEGSFTVKATVTDADNATKQFSASVAVSASEGQCK